VRSVQVTPSGEVIISCAPVVDTAQNKVNSGDQQIAVHESYGAFIDVQLIPSGDVMTLSVPLLDTAQKIPNSGDQAIPIQLFSPAPNVV
jgi:hypothetical protein